MATSTERAQELAQIIAPVGIVGATMAPGDTPRLTTALLQVKGGEASTRAMNALQELIALINAEPELATAELFNTISHPPGSGIVVLYPDAGPQSAFDRALATLVRRAPRPQA